MSRIYFFLILIQQILSNPIFNIWNSTSEDENEIQIPEFVKNRTKFARVLNFFPVPVEEECRSNDGRRAGICMNAYECRIQSGKSYGPCALGFGVCCVFTATCNQDIFNNITYFVNPHFPDLSRPDDPNMTNCTINVRKIDPEISQLRLDFIHFNLGQPNRRTGVCDEDVFILEANAVGKKDVGRQLKLCGLNSGQHAYFDVDDVDADLSPIKIEMRLNRKAVSRLWEVKITQIPFSERAPVGCLQYHQGVRGRIETMNFADNGRHLADQDYNICMRQEEGMCSIAYEPCHENAFRIGANRSNATSEGDEVEGSGGGEDLVALARSVDNCVDKIILPCDSEDLIMPGDSMPIACDVVHCGPSLCPNGATPCRLESSVTPFQIGVHFEDSEESVKATESPEDNLGMCLNYEQLPCNV